MIRRRLFNIASALSLLLCLATLVLWVQSKLIPITRLLITEPTRTIFVGSSNGRLRVWSQEIAPTPPQGVVVRLTNPHKFRVAAPGRAGTGVEYNWPDETFEWSMKNDLGSGMLGGLYNYKVIESHFQVAWCLVAVLSFLPAIPFLWTCRIRRHRGLNEQCRMCGYNLTGNTSGTCPECGTPIPAAPVPHAQ